MTQNAPKKSGLPKTSAMNSLSFEDALSGLLAVDPKKIAKPVKKASAKKKAVKKAAKKKV